MLVNRIAQAFRKRNGVKIDYFHLFETSSPIFRENLARFLEKEFPDLPFFVHEKSDRGVMVTGTINRHLTNEVFSSPVKIVETMKNPYVTKLNDKLVQYRSQIKKHESRFNQLDAKIRNPHIFPPGQKDGKRKLALIRRRDMEKKRQDELIGLSEKLKKELGVIPDIFVAEISGEVALDQTSVAADLSIVESPSADIIHDGPIEVEYHRRKLVLNPNEDFGFKGLVDSEVPPDMTDAELMSSIMASKVGDVIASSHLARLEALVAANVRIASSKEELLNMTYLMARRFERAIEARPAYEGLLARIKEGGTDKPAVVEFIQDSNKGFGKQGVQLKVVPVMSLSRCRLEKERLEKLHMAYWQFIPRLDRALQKLFMVSIRDIIELRSQLDGL